jgi:TolB-like protein
MMNANAIPAGRARRRAGRGVVGAVVTALAVMLVPLSGAWAQDTTATPAQQPAPDRAPARQVIGVLPFAVDAKDTLLGPLAYGLTDLLATDLARSRRLTLVERARLGALLREQDLATRGVVDPATAPRVGQLLQAQRIVGGSLQRHGENEIRFGARVMDAEAGREETALDATASLDDVLAAEKEVAFRLFEHLGINLTPEERALVEQRPTRNLPALLAYGRGVESEVNGQYAAAARWFRRATALDPGFANAVSRARTASANASQIAAASAIRNVNPPREPIAAEPLRGVATDAAFPASRATVVITITRP